MRNAGYHTWYIGKWHNVGRPSDWGYDECQALFGAGDRNWVSDIPFDWKGRKITGYPGCVFQTDDGKLLREKGVGLTPNISEQFADAAIEFIRRKPSKPFFLHVNFTAPHDPLLMPPGYEEQYKPEEIPLPPDLLPEHPFDTGYLRTRDELLLSWPRTPEAVRDELAMYYLVISHMDAQIGRILAALQTTGQAAGTIVIFTSDQGVAIGSHGLRGKQNMYEHTIGVPLIIAGPGIPEGIHCNAQCYLRDLYPTACDLAGIDVPQMVQGKSLVPLLRGDTTSIYPSVFAAFGKAQRMIRTDRWKLIHYPKIERFQLFNLSADPHELNDLAAGPCRAAVIADLRVKLEACQNEAGDPLRIVALGDSITNGAGLAGVTESDAFRDIVRRELAKRLGSKVEVVNAGVNGDIVTLAAERLKRDVLDCKPDIVTVMFGGNEAGFYRPETKGFADTPRVDRAEFKATLAKIVDRIQAEGITVVLMTCPPMTDRYGGRHLAAYKKHGINFLVKDYAQAMRDVAAEKRVELVDVYRSFDQAPSRLDFFPDGLHPDARGHRVIADLLIERLTRIIGQPRHN